MLAESEGRKFDLAARAPPAGVPLQFCNFESRALAILAVEAIPTGLAVGDREGPRYLRFRRHHQEDTFFEIRAFSVKLRARAFGGHPEVVHHVARGGFREEHVHRLSHEVGAVGGHRPELVIAGNFLEVFEEIRVLLCASVNP